MRIASALTAFVAFYVAAISSEPAHAGVRFVPKRVALVIGNSNYADMMRLPNVGNDSRAIAALFRTLGFGVVLVQDADRRSMLRALHNFSKRVEDAELAAVFYAGHGVSADGTNYLLPVDAKITAQHDLSIEAIDFSTITRMLETRPRTNLYFIDAARTNPFSNRTRGVANKSGFAPLSVGVGSLVSFSTSAGSQAMDGRFGENSPYVAALLKQLAIPDLELRTALDAVSRDVEKETNGIQRPEYHSTLTRQVYLAGRPEKQNSPSKSPAPQTALVDPVRTAPQARTTERVDTAEQAFKLVQGIGQCHAYRAFEKRYSDTFYADVARAYIAEKCKPNELRVAAASPTASNGKSHVLSSAPKTANPKRIALLVGNQGYNSAIGPLKNPHNDIRILTAALRTARFDVMDPVKEATRKGLRQAVRAFARRLASQGTKAVGFFYYSGHGAAETDKGPNYLIPVDASSMNDDEVWDDSVPLPWVIETLTTIAPKATHFIVFDACRNELKRTTFRNAQKGFVPVREKSGVFVAFATSPGTRALDGEPGTASPYANALAKQIVIPDQHHLDVFQSAKEQVYDTTKSRQMPWERNGLPRRFYFMGTEATATARQ